MSSSIQIVAERMTSVARLLVIKSCTKLLQCNVRTIKTIRTNEELIIRGPPRKHVKWTDERKFPYEIANPYRVEPEPEKREYEESTAEWHYVEKLLPKLVIPEPNIKGIAPSGWKNPTDEPPNLPYYVNRSRNLMHPVYLEIRNGGSRKFTVVRHVKGDVWAFEKDMKTHLESKQRYKIPTHVHEPAGAVRFKGDYVREIKEWLADTGF